MAFHKRKRFWVDASLQLQILGYVLFLVTASLVLVAFSILRGLSAASADSRQLFHSIDWVRQSLEGPLILSSCTAILASGVVALLWSHRLAGPLRVLSAAFGRMSQADLSVPARIRATDTHQELVRDFAQAQKRVRDLLDEDRGKLKRVAARLRDAADGGSKKELEAAAGEIDAILSEFRL